MQALNRIPNQIIIIYSPTTGQCYGGKYLAQTHIHTHAYISRTIEDRQAYNSS